MNGDSRTVYANSERIAVDQLIGLMRNVVLPYGSDLAPAHERQLELAWRSLNVIRFFDGQEKPLEAFIATHGTPALLRALATALELEQ